MSLTWNNCVLIYDSGNFASDISKEQKNKVQDLLSQYGEEDVWWDPRTKSAFSINQNSFNGAKGKERSFLSGPEDFIYYKGMLCNDCGGKIFCEETLGAVLGNDITYNTEYVIHNSDVFRRAKDSTVMIVGGGPSAVEVDWTEYDYDQLWSCNHFFLNERLASRNVDLWVAGDEVDLFNDKRLHSYINNVGTDSWCCLYPTRAPIQRKKVEGTHKYVKDLQEILPRITYSHLRYRSKIGIAPRLLLLAIFAGAKKIYIVGMDGVPSSKTKHAFQPGKKPKGTCAKPDAKNIFRIQYVQLWDYILRYLNPGIEIVNLGENIAGNMSADITKRIK